jgi:hypothetical protein
VLDGPIEDYAMSRDLTRFDLGVRFLPESPAQNMIAVSITERFFLDP